MPGPTVAMIRVSPDYAPEVGILGHNGKWYVAGPRFGSQHGWSHAQVEVIRPLALVDLAPAAARFVSDVLEQNRHDWTLSLAESLRPLLERPEEPTTWGVVEAACVHVPKRRPWVRHPDGNWWPALDYGPATSGAVQPDDWDSLVDPRVVRDGV